MDHHQSVRVPRPVGDPESDVITLDDLAGPRNVLAPHYSRFRVAERLLLTGHSHQAWPDVAREAQLEAFDVAAEAVDEKWSRAFEKAEAVREGYRNLLGEPGGTIALGANTHELLVRFLSALDLPRRRRLVTTDAEFHSARRQLLRLSEEDIDLVVIAADPVPTLAERLAAEVDSSTAAVIVSSVLFETSRRVPGLSAVATACTTHGAELLVDAYHQLGVVPMDLDTDGLEHAWVVGGGYKYLQLGEGNCFLRLPSHAERMRPVVTGWYAEYGELAAGERGTVSYARGADRFAGSTYDTTSHHRAARVFEFFTDQALTPALLREVSQHQRSVLSDSFDALGLPEQVITRDRETPPEEYAGFLALTTPHAAALQEALRARGVRTDARGNHLRFGPAPYLTDRQLRDAMTALGEAAADYVKTV